MNISNFTLYAKRYTLQKGFTLIEILVVIAIIGILSSVGLTAYTATQRNSRDARRKTDLETLRQTLELYKSTNSVYPNNPALSGLYSSEGSVKSALTGNGSGGPFISGSSYPKDPEVSSGNHYTYLGPDRSGTGKYLVCAHLESGGIVGDPCSIEDCGAFSEGAKKCNYSVTQP